MRICCEGNTRDRCCRSICVRSVSLCIRHSYTLHPQRETDLRMLIRDASSSLGIRIETQWCVLNGKTTTIWKTHKFVCILPHSPRTATITGMSRRDRKRAKAPSSLVLDMIVVKHAWQVIHGYTQGTSQDTF